MLQLRGNLTISYNDVLTRDALAALNALAPLDVDRRQLMQSRLDRRAERQRRHERIVFLDPHSVIGRTSIRVQDARDGKFAGSEIPADLQRQWIQGTGPAAKPNSPVAQSIRNVAHALLSGADGWMFDGEDALGQLETMSLENQRNLKLAIDRAPVFLKAAESVAREMGLEVDASILQARSAGAAIVDMARESGTELIVMATDYQKKLGELDLGRTIPYVMKHAACRVYICRAPMPENC